MPEPLLTVGHGRLDRAQLSGLLVDARVELLVDVRRFPGSRANPDVARDAMSRWLPEAGLGYRWEERLGGRRSLPAEDDQDPWWQVAAFRAYAAHTRSADFRTALTDLLTDATSRRVAVMCSESVWWRCHRRLIADVAVVAHDVEVHHLMHDRRLVAHEPSSGARVTSAGIVVWDA